MTNPVPPWLDTLNPRQQEAVTHPPAPLLVLAGPGTGKTRILTNRIAWLVRGQGARPEGILAVTFTNRAAEEMRERLAVGLGEEASRVWVYTFHAAAVRILRRFGSRVDIDPDFSIIDEREQRQAFGQLLQRLGLSREVYALAQVAAFIGQRKTSLQLPSAAAEADPALIAVADAYEEWLRQRRALDFDDLIRAAVGLLRQDAETRRHYHHTLHHILVDEYQDIDAMQYELLKLMAPPDASITIVADDDQSIYGWRGSKPELIDEFITRYRPHVVKLETSYRCSPHILGGAQGLISHQRSQQRQRLMHSASTAGAPIFHYIFQTIQQEQQWLRSLIGKLIEERGYRPGEIAILYRTHRLAPATEQTLLQAGYKVQRLRKESFFDEPQPREIVRYLLLARALQEETFGAAINFPLRLIDELTMIQLQRLADAQELNLIELARRADAYQALSPLTRAHLRRFLALIEARLPALQVDIDQGLTALFALLEELRSPWRGEARDLLAQLLTYAPDPDAIQALKRAIDGGQPLLILHPPTLDGHAAAHLLRAALEGYFGVQAPARVAPTADDLTAAACWLLLGEVADLPAGEHEGIRLAAAGDLPLAVQAWRCLQTLLISYEHLAEGCFVVYDVETTGVNVQRDEIVELAATRYSQRQADPAPFHTLIKPERGYIPRAATTVHGIRTQDVLDASSLSEMLPDFLHYVAADTVVGHNITHFDNRFIDRACGLLQEGRGFHPHFIDTLRLARRLLPELQRHGLDALLHELEIDQDVTHRAGRDVAATAELFFTLADYILEEREGEALAEALPLLGLVTLAAGEEPAGDRLLLAQTAARTLKTGRGEGAMQAFLAALPAAWQEEATALAARLADLPLPATAEDEAWAALKADFATHAEAFKVYSSDNSVAAFLDYQALLSSVDTFSHLQDEDHISLMTLHNAKGAEFPVVIIIGLEHENLPLWRALQDPDALAEERRVFYVGLTRASDAVYLFSTRNRRDGYLRSPSPFAFEIPAEHVRRFQIDSRGQIREMA